MSTGRTEGRGKREGVSIDPEGNSENSTEPAEVLFRLSNCRVPKGDCDGPEGEEVWGCVVEGA